MEGEIKGSIDLSSNLYDRKPITWLIRELENQIKSGKDYVEFTSEKEFSDTNYILIFS